MDPQERNQVIERLRRMQSISQETLATGMMPLKDEIRMRSMIADLILQSCAHIQDAGLLDDAIQYYETIVRRVSVGSIESAKYAGSLVQARISRYQMSRSKHSLDQAIEDGVRAERIANDIRLRELDADAYINLMDGLSFAFSHRNTLHHDPEDLDAAILRTRKFYDATSPGSRHHMLALNNLASQLRRKFDQNQDITHLDEAGDLTAKLLQVATPGTEEYAIAEGHLGFILWAKSKNDGSEEILDQAIEHCKNGLNGLPEGHEVRRNVLQVLVALYERHLHHSNNNNDQADLVHYSRLLVQSIPQDHRDRGHFLLEYLQHLEEFHPMLSLLSLKEVTRQVHEELSMLPPRCKELQRCQVKYSNLLGSIYQHSGELYDLLNLVDFCLEMIDQNNVKVQKPGSSVQAVFGQPVRSLGSLVRRIFASPPESPMRTDVEQELAGLFLSCSEPGMAAAVTLDDMYNAQGSRLEVLTTATETQQLLSEDEITAATAKMENSLAPAAQRDEKQPVRLMPLAQDYNAFRKRTLAIESGSKTIMWDFGGLLEDEYPDLGDVGTTKENFIAREERLETKALERAWKQGRHPNLDLCRTCRDYTKPLRYSDNGFELTAKHSIRPHGNYHQLLCRNHCAICSLIFSAITDSSRELTPTLEAIDKEVQGTRVSTGCLSTGERVMRVDYGLRHVTDLRIAIEDNCDQALRQAWELNNRQQAHY